MKSQRTKSIIALAVASAGSIWLITHRTPQLSVAGVSALSINALNEANTDPYRLREVAKLVAEWSRNHPSEPVPSNRQLVRNLLTSHDLTQGGVQDEQLVDGWGTAYWITSNGAVRSAGPDRTYFTQDDLVHGEDARSPAEPNIFQNHTRQE